MSKSFRNGLPFDDGGSLVTSLYVKSYGYQQITSLNTATLLTVPVGATKALISAESQAVRWRDDGVDPTTSVGYPLAIGAELDYTADQISLLKFIEQTAGAKINVFYYA